MSKLKNFATAALSVCVFAVALTGTFFLVNAESTLTDITAPETGFNKVVHYEFNDETNLGKDSLGNYDLVAQNVAIDPLNGGVALKNGGVLYAPALDGDGTDFSDLIKGSYSVSMRIYTRAVGDGGNYIVATGSYGSNFQVDWNYNGLGVDLGNEQSGKFGVDKNNAASLGGINMFDSAYSWYRVTMIYDESASSFRVKTTKEGDGAYLFDYTKTLTSAVTFGGSEYNFTIGGQSKFGASLAQQAYTTIDSTYTIHPNISDFRLYSGVIDETEISAIAVYDATNLAAPATGYKGVVHYEFNDETNLGKDSLGNYDLGVGAGVEVDKVNGGVTLGKTKGIFYAQPLYPATVNAVSGEADFSDLVKGSYSISMRMYLRANNGAGGGNALLRTGSKEKAFSLDYNGNDNGGFMLALNDSQVDGVDNKIDARTGLFEEAFAWYRITIIYNYEETALIMKIMKEGATEYLLDKTETTNAVESFGGHEYSFTLGAQSKFGQNIAYYADITVGGVNYYPNISDFRLYSGVIDEAEIAAIAQYDEDNLPENVLAKNSEVLGASIRLTGDSGLRFLATLNESTVNEYVERFGEENVSFGMKLVRNQNGKYAYAYVSAVNKTLEDGVYSFNAVITGLTPDYFATEYTAQVYISYTVNGETTYVVSESEEESKTRSISYVANSALNDTYTVDETHTIADKPAHYRYEIKAGVWSPYSATTREKLQGFVVS